MRALLFVYTLLPFSLLTKPVFAIAPNTVIATINVGITPVGMAVTPNNQYVYVANNNNYGFTGVGLGVDSVSVIDVATNLPVAVINDPSFYLNQPYTVTINPAGTKAYVTNSAGSTVTIINTANNTVLGTITDFDGPSGMVITPDGSTGYVNNYGGPILGSGNGHTISVVNLNTNLITSTINLTPQFAPAALAITPNGAFVYVANYNTGNPGTGTVSVIRTSNNTIVTTITDASLSGPFAIAITPDGNYAYVTNFGSNNFAPFGTTVSVIDLNTNTVIDVIELIGIQPSGLAITPDGSLAYVSTYNTLYANPTGFGNLTPGQGVVSIIDTATNTVIPPTIAVDQAPDAIAITPDGQYAFVSNFISNTVNAIALQSFQVTGSGCQTQDVFLTQTDFINQLTWSATGPSLPVSYSIYRDAGLTNLVAIVPATGPLIFLDHDRQPGQTYTYYIIGTNSVGTTSDPVSVTVTQNC